MRIAKIIGGVAVAVLLAACPDEGQAPAKGEGIALEPGDGGPPWVVPADAAEAGADGETVVVLEPAPGQGPIDPLSPEMLEAAARAAEAAEAAEAGASTEGEAEAGAEAEAAEAEAAGAEAGTGAEAAGVGAAGAEAGAEADLAAIDPNEGRAVGRLAQLNPERVSPFTVLPAISADGRYLAVTRYEQHEDHALVEIVRVRDGRTRRRLELDWDGDGARRINRALERGAFRTMPAIAHEPIRPPRHDWQARPTTWKKDDFELRYDPRSGGLAFYEGYRLVGQALVDAREPSYSALWDPDAGPVRLIPNVMSVFTSEDGEVIAVELGLCNCSCDIDPFWRVFRRDDLPMPR